MEVLLRAALSNVLSASLLATVVAAVGLILSRRPAVLHYLWLIVLVKLLAPPMWEVPLAIPRDEAAAIMGVLTPAESTAPEPIPVDAASSAPWMDPETLWGLLGAAWLAGSLAASGLSVVRVRRFQRLLAEAEPAGPGVECEVADLSARLNIRRPPKVGFISGKLTPMLWSVGRPRLVIPRELWDGLDDRRRTLLLTHELAHLKRGDHRLRLFELAVTIAYWWLPIVWWVRRALRDVEEQCCDAWVVWMFPDEARTYAETLLDTVDFLNPVAESEPLLASGFGKVHHLRRRLTMVMMGTTPRTLGWSGTLGALALTGILMPLSPTWAQRVERPTEAVEAPTPAHADSDASQNSPIPVLLVAASREHGKRHEARRDHADRDREEASRGPSDKDNDEDKNKDKKKSDHAKGDSTHSKGDHGKADHARSRHAKWSREKSDHAKRDHEESDPSKRDHAKSNNAKRDHERSDHAKCDHEKSARDKRGHERSKHDARDHGKPNHSRSRYAKWSREKSDHAKRDHEKSDRNRRDHEESDHTKSDHGKRDHEKSDHSRSDHGKRNHGKSDRRD